MVFYGTKNQASGKKQQYESIKIQILKQIGEGQQKQKQKSLANMVNYCGNKILTLFQFILRTPNSIQQTQEYQWLKQDQSIFLNDVYKSVKQFSQLKLSIISAFDFRDRLMMLNIATFSLSLLTLSRPTGLGFLLRIKNMCRRAIIFYPLAGLLIAPQIYNPILKFDVADLK